MPKFIIEREVPGAGKLSASEVRGLSQKSCGVLREMDVARAARVGKGEFSGG